MPLVTDSVENNDNLKERSPTSVKDVILASSKSILGKVLSPTKDKLANNREKVSKIFLNYMNVFCSFINLFYITLVNMLLNITDIMFSYI